MILYDFKLILSTAVGDLLGTATLANGASVPALFVRNTGQDVNPSVQGLELVIRPLPVDADNQPLLGTGSSATVTWQAYLIQWNSAPYTIMQAVQVLRFGVKNIQMVSVPTPDNAAVLEQVSIRLTDTSYRPL